MAYATRDSDALRNAILRVSTPTVGARSWVSLMETNTEKIFPSAGPCLAPFMIRDHIPINLHFPIEFYSDDRPPFQFKEKMLSGSWSEGLHLNGYSNMSIPDMDFMLVLDHISFSEESQRCGNLILKEDTPFLDAYITNKAAANLWQEFLHDRDVAQSNRLSSKKLKEKLLENHALIFGYALEDNATANVDGAAVCTNGLNHFFFEVFNSVQSFISKDNASEDGAARYTFRVDNSFSHINSLLKSVQSFISKENASKLHACVNFFKYTYSEVLTGCDIVLAISCDGWPFCAREWITRDRIWPQTDLIQKIINDGFHIVPKSSTEGDFRLSFSYAETTLIESLSKLQHKVLRSFKAVVKFHQSSWSPNIKDIITTYHLKTIAFWYFEKRMQNSFTEETVGTHLVLLLQELAGALRSRELPMYFMPKVNLFRNADNPEEVIDIADKIEELSNNFGLVIKGIENFRLPRNIKQKLQEISQFVEQAKFYLQLLNPQN